MPLLVAGSINTDLVIRSSRLPSPGETVLGGEFNAFGGGKGANQAVAAARAGAYVVFAGAVGNDDFGRARLVDLRRDGVDLRHIQTIDGVASGVALIMVDGVGENIIAVSPGANARVTPAAIDAAFDGCPDARIALVQLEIPIDAVEQLAMRCVAAGKSLILNPAPCPPNGLPDALIRNASIITPNRTEFALLGGPNADDVRDEKTVRAIREFLSDNQFPTVVLSLGKDGAALFEPGKPPFIVPAPKVNAVDAVGAGDCLNGVLAAVLSGGKPLESALRTAVRAASISVTRPGAQPSMPTRSEIENP
ncbi:MAG: ribokinase [Planctomycetota bacterium]